MTRDEFIQSIMGDYNDCPNWMIFEGCICQPVDEAYACDFFREFANFYLNINVPDDVTEENPNEWKHQVWENFNTNDSLVNEFMAFTGMEMPEWEV